MTDHAVEIIQSSMREFLSEKDPMVTEINCPLIPRRSGGWAIMNPSMRAFLPDMKRSIRVELEGVWDDD